MKEKIIQQKIYLLEKVDYKENSYNKLFSFVEAPKDLKITKFFNKDILLINNEEFSYIDKKQEENFAEYTLASRDYEHLNINDRLYTESITCFDCNKMTQKQSIDFIEKYIDADLECLATQDEESIIYAKTKDELENKSINISNKADKVFQGIEWIGEGIYIVAIVNFDWSTVMPLDSFISNSLITYDSEEYKSLLERFDK